MSKRIAGYWLIPLFGACALAQAAELRGQLDFARRVELGLPVSGVVAEVAVNPGDWVKKGQKLLALDSRPLAATVREAEAEFKRLAEAAQEAQREGQRAEELFNRTLLSQHELQLAQIERSAAAARREAAAAKLARAKLDLEYATLEAPFEAVVLERRAEPGQTVVSELRSEPLLVVAQSGRMLVRSELPLAQVGALKEGQTVEVRLLQGQPRQGRIERIGLEPLRRDGEPVYLLEVVIPAASGDGLRAGMAATVVVP